MAQLQELIEAIDAIEADIESNVTMPKHRTELYAKPMSILPEHCPMLAIWPERSPWEIIAIRTDGREKHVGSARESQGSDVESVSNDELGDRAQQSGSQATEVNTNPNGAAMDQIGEIAGQVLDEAKQKTQPRRAG